MIFNLKEGFMWISTGIFIVNYLYSINTYEIKQKLIKINLMVGYYQMIYFIQAHNFISYNFYFKNGSACDKKGAGSNIKFCRTLIFLAQEINEGEFWRFAIDVTV